MTKKGIYKIRDPETGLFSTGGSTPAWHKTGKIWKQLGHIKAHLNQFRSPAERRIRSWDNTDYADYSKAEIVEFEMVEIDTQPVAELLDEVKETQRKREEDRLEQYRKAKEDREKAELRKLKVKYPNV